jgi:hypothetical protein
MEAVCSSETSVDFQGTTQHHIPAHSTVQMDLVHIILLCFCKIHFNMMLLLMPKSPKWGLALKFSDQIFCTISYFHITRNWEIVSLLTLPTGKMYVVGLIPSLGYSFHLRYGHTVIK